MQTPMLNQGILIHRPNQLITHPVIYLPRRLERLPKVIQEMLFKFLRFYEVAGLLNLSRTLTGNFPGWIYSNMCSGQLWKVQFVEHFNGNLDNTLQISQESPSYTPQQFRYRFQFQEAKISLAGTFNTSEIELSYPCLESEAPNEQPTIVEHILKINQSKINQELLREIPSSSHLAFFAILATLTPNQVNDEIDLKRFQYLKSIILNKDKLAKACRDNIIVAYHVINDPWMCQRLPYVERYSPNIIRFSVFGWNEKLYQAAVVIIGILAFLSLLAALACVIIAVQTTLIVLPLINPGFIILGAMFLPFLFLPLLYTLMKFLAQLGTGVASTMQRRAEIYETILTLQNDIPTDTFLAQEKIKIEAFLTQKHSNLAAQRSGLFTLFYRNNAEKIQGVKKALTALQQVCSIETLASYKDQYLSEQDLMDLHFYTPIIFNAVNVNAVR